MEFAREPLSPDELPRFISAALTGEEKLIVWTLLDTGLRVSEFASLTKDSIDFQSHDLSVIGKGKKKRKVPIPGRTREILEAYLIANDQIRIGKRQIQRVVAKVARRAKIKRTVSPHVLRHTYAVGALKKGVSLPVLMRLLGHSNLQTTQIYLNLSYDDVKKEVDEKW